MNFEEAFAHYKDGIATEEEKEFVKEQLAIANKVVADDEKRTPAQFVEASNDDVKKAKKKFKLRYIVIPAISIVCVLLVVAAILGGVFGSAATYASKAVAYSKFECKEAAYSHVLTLVENGKLPTPIGEIEIDDVDREFNYVAHDITKSYYSYYVELEYDGAVRSGEGRQEIEVIVEIDTRTLAIMGYKVKD